MRGQRRTSQEGAIASQEGFCTLTVISEAYNQLWREGDLQNSVIAKLNRWNWSRAHDDLPGLVQSLQPKIDELARAALAFVASIAGALLLFLAAIILAGIFMAFGGPEARACEAIFQRIAGKETRRGVQTAFDGDHSGGRTGSGGRRNIVDIPWGNPIFYGVRRV